MYKSFIFEKYYFDEAEKTLQLKYSLDEKLHFEETYKFDFDFKIYDQNALDKAFQQLFFMAGVSYFKTYTPKTIIVKTGSLNKDESEFYSKTYQKGLGEFWYINKLDPKTPVNFPINSDNTYQTYKNSGNGFLVAVGGGKDSLVSIELLTNNSMNDISTWSLNHRPQLEPLVKRIGLPHLYVERTIDNKLLNPEELPDSYNGHIPISAIFACTGTIVAILAGKRDVVMSNERSADEPTLQYDGVEINHQYSKSSEFEQDFQSRLNGSFSDTVRYYSVLRPLSEIQISKQFVNTAFQKYHDVFSSCNQAFVHGNNKLFWDGTCSKCAFVYLVLSPYLSQDSLTGLIGHNLLLDPALEITYKQLLGVSGDKPLECVGEIAESRWAMDKMKEKYPELKVYIYPAVPDEDIFYIGNDQMPEEIRSIILPIFEKNLLQK